MSQRQGSRHPHVGWGRSPCSVLGQQEKSSSQLQVLGLTREPHCSSFPPKSCHAASLSRKPWDAAVWWSSPAQPLRRVLGPLTHH